MAEALDYRASHQGRGVDYDAALKADPWSAYMHDREARLLSSIVPRLMMQGRRKRRSLDFACGTGRITRLIEPFAAESIGVDVSESMIEQARRKSRTSTFHLIDAFDVEQWAGSFDLITAFRFLGNADDASRRSALSLWRRLIHPQGRLIVNNHRNPRAPMYAVRRWRGEGATLDLTHGKLVRLLPGWSLPPAPVTALLPSRTGRSARQRVFLDAARQFLDPPPWRGKA